MNVKSATLINALSGINKIIHFWFLIVTQKCLCTYLRSLWQFTKLKYTNSISYMYMFFLYWKQAEFAQCKMGLFEKQKQLLMQEKRRYMIVYFTTCSITSLLHFVGISLTFSAEEFMISTANFAVLNSLNWNSL